MCTFETVVLIDVESGLACLFVEEAEELAVAHFGQDVFLFGQDVVREEAHRRAVRNKVRHRLLFYGRNENQREPQQFMS